MSAGGQAGRPQVEVLGKSEAPEGHPDHLIEKDWAFDDFSSMAHAELERHREARHYARITAYEMPRLSGIFIVNVLRKKGGGLQFSFANA